MVSTVSTKIPQLRIAVTFPCGKACVYCRPGGEAVPIQPKKEMTRAEIHVLTRILVEHGISDIKLTGGDPLLRDDIVDIVRDIKSIDGVRSVHLVTRHARAAENLRGFVDAGLDLLNFSLDSLDPKTWSAITRAKGHDELIKAVELAAQSGLKLKLNTVVMKGINDHEINDLIEFAGRLKCTVKFLDLIVDIPAFPKVSQEIGHKYYADLDELVPALKQQALISDLHFQPGGLGHPMSRFVMPNGATVVIKSSNSGAWYGDVCANCTFFPCHDAIMSLRLTSDGKLQRCLLREDNLIDLLSMVNKETPQKEIDAVIRTVLATYQEAVFYEAAEIQKRRARRMLESIEIPIKEVAVM